MTRCEIASRLAGIVLTASSPVADQAAILQAAAQPHPLTEETINPNSPISELFQAQNSRVWEFQENGEIPEVAKMPPPILFENQGLRTQEAGSWKWNYSGNYIWLKEKAGVTSWVTTFRFKESENEAEKTNFTGYAEGEGRVYVEGDCKDVVPTPGMFMENGRLSYYFIYYTDRNCDKQWEANVVVPFTKTEPGTEFHEYEATVTVLPPRGLIFELADVTTDRTLTKTYVISTGQNMTAVSTVMAIAEYTHETFNTNVDITVPVIGIEGEFFSSTRTAAEGPRKIGEDVPGLTTKLTLLDQYRDYSCAEPVTQYTQTQTPYLPAILKDATGRTCTQTEEPCAFQTNVTWFESPLPTPEKDSPLPTPTPVDSPVPTPTSRG